MSKFALGTAQFGLEYGVANRDGQVSREEVKQILRMAWENGLDTIDTAIAYGDSEQILGEIGVGGFKIVTKLPSLPDGSLNVEDWVVSQMSASLERLRVESVYGVLLHCTEDLLGQPAQQLVGALERLKSSGITEKIGISIYSPSELDRVDQVANIDLVQAPLNLLDRRLETSGWLKRLHNRGIEVHTRSAFLQGLLLMSRSEIPEKFERWSQIWDSWHAGLDACQTTAPTACLRYPLSLPEVDRVVVGVDSVRHMEELIHASQRETLDNDWLFMVSEDEELISPSRWSLL